MSLVGIIPKPANVYDFFAKILTFIETTLVAAM